MYDLDDAPAEVVERMREWEKRDGGWRGLDKPQEDSPAGEAAETEMDDLDKRIREAAEVKGVKVRPLPPTISNIREALFGGDDT